MTDFRSIERIVIPPDIVKNTRMAGYMRMGPHVSARS